MIDVEAYLSQDPERSMVECKKVAECLHKFGILLFRDPRADARDNDDYLDLMEQYFEKTSEKHYRGETLQDAKPEHYYQVGVTPENIEKARDHSEFIKTCLHEQNKPFSPLEPTFDSKWRFMWKIGQRPERAADDFPQVIPSDFSGWE